MQQRDDLILSRNSVLGSSPGSPEGTSEQVFQEEGAPMATALESGDLRAYGITSGCQVALQFGVRSSTIDLYCRQSFIADSSRIIIIFR